MAAMYFLCSFLGYALVVWIFALMFGIWSWDDEMDEMEWFMAGLWPLTIIFFIALGISNFVSWLWKFMPWKEPFMNFMCRLSIVFKPFVIGKKLQQWWNSKKDRKFLEEKEKREKENPGNG